MPLIRLAEMNDAAPIFDLAQSFATSFTVEQQAFHHALSELIANQDAFIAVAENQGQIIGYVLGFDHYTFFANGRVAWVEEITVHECHRLNGIGRLLMARFEEWSRSRGAKLIALATRRASPFYLALGYEESATYFRKLM